MIIFSKQLLYKPKNKSIYEPNQVISTLASAGNTTVELLDSGIYELIMVGGGAGAVMIQRQAPVMMVQIMVGGSGNAFIGQVRLEKGSYSVSVGAGKGGGEGNGGNTTFGTTIVNGGVGPTVTQTDNTITYPIVQTTMNSQGNPGAGNAAQGGSYPPAVNGGASLYGGYGAGSRWTGSALVKGTDGYFKLTYIGK